MSVAASNILGFLEERRSFKFERHEIAIREFEILRRSLRQIVMKLGESDDHEAVGISDGIRSLLSEWLTTPIKFDTLIERSIAEVFGNRAAVTSRWGSDIATFFEAAREAAANLGAIQSPLRNKLKETIQELSLQGLRFKIYCHRRARPHFDSLLGEIDDFTVTDDLFLHSVRDYRDCETFDVLIKVGPLRSRGWGSAPDAIWTAPRFDVLKLIVWSGSNDEPGFGYDPSQSTETRSRSTSSPHAGASHLPEWSEEQLRTGDYDNLRGMDGADWDELSVFAEKTHSGDNRAAKFVQVDEEHGIFYPPYSRVLSFNPLSRSREPISSRIPGETLVEGMFVIIPELEDVDLGDLQARHGDYSRVWKARLRDAIISNRDELLERLRSAGLDLMHLESAINHWSREPGTVIHAPQRIAHFGILIHVLGIEDDAGSTGSHSAIPWWKRAWIEIRESRGDAIQAGQLEQELIDEQLATVLGSLLPDIRREASVGHSFVLAVPAASGMSGTLRFFPVTAIEDGFSVPDGELRVVKNLAVIDQWRD
jgi:hypothetical protein